MKFWGKKFLLSEDEESAEKKKSRLKGGSETLIFFPFEDPRPSYVGLFLGEEYWSAVPFSPDLSPLCTILLAMGLEEAGTSFPAVDSVLVE